MGVGERITYLDTLKGVCIILVVLMHCGLLVEADCELARHVNDALRTYRMPTYFFLSGVFFKTYSGLKEFARRKVNNILVPLLFFYALNFVGWVLISTGIGVVTGNHDPIEWGALFDLFYRVDWRLRAASPLWFLFSLLWANLIFYILKSHLGDIAVCVSVLLLAIAGYLIESAGVQIPWRFCSALVGLPYFELGYYVNRFGWIKCGTIPWLGLAQFVIVGTIVLFIARDYAHLASVGEFLYHRYVIPFASILSLFWLCKSFPRRVPVVTFLGRYSLIVLGTHMFLIIYISLIQMKAFPGVSESLWRSCMFVTVIALELLIVPLLRDKFPQFTAQREFFAPDWRISRSKK
jgi:fucose 4-O-acetylase-like acetyltransferase